MSAPPSATRPNLSAEPNTSRMAPGRSAMKASVRRSRCERLTATTQGSPPLGCRRRVWIGSAPSPSVVFSRSAPRPTSPRQTSPSAGAPMMPSKGVPFVTSARLTVNSSRPPTNSLVPSSGSIRKKLPSYGGVARSTRSSDRDGIRGASRANPSAMTRSAARSASVTGDPSILPSILIAARLTAIMAAPARITRSVRGCISAAAASPSMTAPDALFMGGSHLQFIFPTGSLSCVGSARVRSVSSPQSMRDSPSPPSADLQEHLMSGTPSPGPVSDALELAALLCSRVCHDLISPVGAIVNGLEVLDDNPKPEDREFALDLIRKSAKTASARLQFCRLAFGAAGSSGAQIDLGDAQAMARGHLEDGKTTIAWNLPRVLLPKNRVKLLLNMMVIAQQTIPRGGVLTVDPVGQGDAFGFRVAASGLNARLPQNIADLLSSGQVSVDAHAVQPYYTRLLAQSCGLSVRLAPEGDAVVVTAS